MHVDDQIVFRTPDLLKQIEERYHCAPSPAALREIASRKKNDIGERRMAAHDLSVFRRDQPVNARPRITRAQLHKHWDRMDDVTEGRRFDQQNAREPCRLQCRRAAVLYSCVLDLPVHCRR